jgi:hypothetical protein
MSLPICDTMAWLPCSGAKISSNESHFVIAIQSISWRSFYCAAQKENALGLRGRPECQDFHSTRQSIGGRESQQPPSESRHEAQTQKDENRCGHRSLKIQRQPGRLGGKVMVREQTPGSWMNRRVASSFKVGEQPIAVSGPLDCAHSSHLLCPLNRSRPSKIIS